MEFWEEPVLTSAISVPDIFSGFDYSDYTMEDFNTNYSTQILEYDEFKNQEWVTSLQYWHPDAEDYLFTLDCGTFEHFGLNYMQSIS